MVKNLKLNKETAKRLTAYALAGSIIVTGAGALSGCDNKNPSNNNASVSTTNGKDVKLKIISDKKEVKFILINKTKVDISNLALKNNTTDTIIKKIDLVLIGKDYENFDGTLELVYNEKNKEFKIIIDDKLFNFEDVGFFVEDNVYYGSEITLVNSKTNEEISEFKPIFEKGTKEIEYAENNNEIQTENDNVLTDETFEELFEEAKNELNNANLAFDEDELRDYLVFVNLTKLISDNPEKIIEVLGNRDTADISESANHISTTIGSNNSVEQENRLNGITRYDEDGKEITFKEVSLIKTISDKDMQRIAQDLIDRIEKIISIEDNKEFSDGVVSLWHDLYNEQSDYALLHSDTIYALKPEFNKLRFAGRNKFNPKAWEAIKYITYFAGDEEVYKINGYLTGAYNHLNGKLNEVVSQCPSLGTPRIRKPQI